MRQMMKRIGLGALALTFLTIGRADAGLIVVPPGSAGTEGDKFIFGTPISSAARTIQEDISASLLSGITVGTSITGLTFRVEGGSTTWPSGTRTFTSYSIELSQAANSPAAMSDTFASNVGNFDAIVRTGPLTIAANAFPGGPGPNAFGLIIDFTVPYTYMGGDLLLTIRHTGNGVDTTFIDAVSSDNTISTRAASEAAATVANISFNASPVVEFRTADLGVSTPEPSTLAGAALAGLGGLVIARRRRKAAVL